MPKFYVKKTSVGDMPNTLIFKGKSVEGVIKSGMILEIPLMGASDIIPVQIKEIVFFENQTDELKKEGLVADFSKYPEDMEVIQELNIADEELVVSEEKL